jgi:hypothetical protein
MSELFFGLEINITFALFVLSNQLPSFSIHCYPECIIDSRVIFPCSHINLSNNSNFSARIFRNKEGINQYGHEFNIVRMLFCSDM